MNQRYAVTSDPASPLSVATRTECQGAEARARSQLLSQAGSDHGPVDSSTEHATSSKLTRTSLLSKGRPHISGYLVLSPLGAGTYGEVWHALEEGTGIPVAIKFFTHGADRQWELLQAEVQQLARLDGVRGIAHLKAVALDASPPYYVMVYAEQGSLAERLERGPLSVPEALAIFHRIAEALAYVHAKGIRHCDLKPGNILLDVRGNALLADFGQAQLSDDTAPALGTYFFMAPEQADLSQQFADTRWDVYGLGALLFTMLTGRPPREDAALREELRSTPRLADRLHLYRERVQQAPTPGEHRLVPGMDRELAEIIDRCLDFDPTKRLHDAGAVLAALERRARRRQQRPILLFALLTPLLLIAGMAAFVLTAVEAGTRRAEASLVQQLAPAELAAALQPLEELRRTLLTVAVVTVLIGGLFTAALWAWLFQWLRRTEHVAYG